MEQESVKEELVQRLKKIEGQTKGIQKMIEDNRNCEDIVIQLMAVRSALDMVAARLIVTHTGRCMDELPSREAKAAVTRAIRLLTKLS